MSYTPEGVAEKVGSAAGLDSRRVRGDLDRFRELVESQQVETGRRVHKLCHATRFPAFAAGSNKRILRARIGSRATD
jgi:protein-disulfide isomerase-like protein with CxxC motif